MLLSTDCGNAAYVTTGYFNMVHNQSGLVSCNVTNGPLFTAWFDDNNLPMTSGCSAIAPNDEYMSAHSSCQTPTTYTFNAQERSTTQFLEETDTTGLIVIKDGEILHES